MPVIACHVCHIQPFCRPPLSAVLLRKLTAKGPFYIGSTLTALKTTCDFRSDREQDEKAEFFHCIPFYVLYLVRRSPLFYSRKFTVQSPVFPLDRRDQTLNVTCGHLGFSLPGRKAPRLRVAAWGSRLLPTPSPFPRPLGSFWTPTHVPLGTFETNMALPSFSTGLGINALTVLHPFPSAISTVPIFVGCITTLEVRVNNSISPEALLVSSRLTNRSASFDVSTSLQPIMLMYYVFFWKTLLE